MAQWIPLLQQIFPAEAFSTVDGTNASRGRFKGRDIYISIDNEAAASAVIRGATRATDVGLSAGYPPEAALTFITCLGRVD